MRRIVEGVCEFRAQVYPQQQSFFELLAAKQQKPEALFITCSDSRINPNLITQTEPGDLFLVRNAGNIVPPHGSTSGGEAATIEYAVSVLGVKHIIICGHSQCGAMHALMQFDNVPELPAVNTWFSYAAATKQIVRQKYQNLSPQELAVVTTEENVLVQMNNLSTHPSVAAKLALGEIKLYGWYYDIATGKILEFDQASGWFRELTDAPQETQAMPIRSGNGAAAHQPVRMA